MTRGELLKLLEIEAKGYRKNALASIARNKHMNDLSPEDLESLKKLDQPFLQRVIDALLVDFINYFAVGQCIDLGLYTKDLNVSQQIQVPAKNQESPDSPGWAERHPDGPLF